jgi:hypothetical protein
MPEETVLLTLAQMANSGTVAFESVIACAAGTEDSELVIVYVYPRPGATNLRLFSTASETVDPNDFENYTEMPFEGVDYFNGYLQQIEIVPSSEKWVVLSFEEAGVFQLSNPIRLKQLTQNTRYRANVHMNDVITGMPLFSWGNIATPDDAIYFQVVSNEQQDLLSGTYTFETTFRYYKTDNVVLDITRNTPPELQPGEAYNFTLLSVSEDNWVNVIANKPFSF